MSKSMNNSVSLQNSNKSSLERADIVIIGNGIAGLTAAVEARHLAPDKRIAIITDQLHPTINTPALKQFAIGKLTREQLLAYPPGTERAERIHLISANVEEIHANSKYLKLQGNRGFGYDSLLIATGGYPQGLPDSIPGRKFDGVMTLHRLEQYLDLRRRLGEVSEAVVVGGGVHAIETAMGLLFWGIRVHWLIRSKTFMRGMLDETASEMVLQSVRRAGAVIHLETEVTGVVGRVGAVAGVITNHQEMIPCELVLSCTGTKPQMSLAKKSTIPIMHQNGIIVDDKLRTSVRDIYAAGDVAALKNPQTDKFEPRAVWYAAIAEARIAGAMMTGHTELAKQPFGVQWHATHLGELSMLLVGEPLSKDPQLTTLTDNSQGGYRRITLMDDRLIGYFSLGPKPPDSLAIKRIIDEGYSVRDFLKPLLKSEFDARAYLSNPRITRSMTTKRLPTPQIESPRPSRSTEERVPNTSKRQTDPLTGEQTLVAAIRQTEPMRDRTFQDQPPQAMPLAMVPQNQPPAIFMPQRDDNEINPFTGNLPTIAMMDTSFSGLTEQPRFQQPASRIAEPRVTVEQPSSRPQEGTATGQESRYKLWAYLNQPEEYPDQITLAGEQYYIGGNQ